MTRDKIVISDFIAQIGARIRFLRYEQGFSLRQLAKLAQSHADSIMQVELGRSAITMDMMCKLSKALNVQPFDLLNHDTETSDVGCIIEIMRQHPESVRPVVAKLRPARRARGQQKQKSGAEQIAELVAA